MKIKSLRLDNFQGIQHAEFDFDGLSASIYGDNATGKTTVFNAVTWLLFDKASTGAKNFTPKTKGAVGDLHNLDHSAEASFIMPSGEIATFKKVYAEAIGYFAYFQLINGFEKYLYMTVKEVRAYAKKYSKAYNSGPWQTEFDAMAKKTVLRRILKYGPMSTEMQRAETLELQNAETAVQMEVARNANQGEVIDVQVVEEQATPDISVNPETGEVLENSESQRTMIGGPEF